MLNNKYIKLSLLSFFIILSVSFSQSFGNSFSQSSGNSIYEIQNLAKLHAQEDARPNGLGWAAGSFTASLFLSPLLGGGVTTLIAYNSKGEYSVPSMRYQYIDDKYNEDGFYHYKSVYELERARLQKKGNGRGALSGAGICWALFFVIIVNN